MREYLALCLAGADTIPARREMLAAHRDELARRIADLTGHIAYIDKKDALYRAILSGEVPYVSNLIDTGADPDLTPDEVMAGL